jgi:hypothetical protein
MPLCRRVCCHSCGSVEAATCPDATPHPGGDPWKDSAASPVAAGAADPVARLVAEEGDIEYPADKLGEADNLRPAPCHGVQRGTRAIPRAPRADETRCLHRHALQDWCLQEHRFVRVLSWKYAFRFNIDPNEELRWMFICGVSVAPKVSLVLSELTASSEMELWVYWSLRLWLNYTFKSTKHKYKRSKIVWVPADEKLVAGRLGS